MNCYDIISLQFQSSQFISPSGSTFSLLLSLYLYHPMTRKRQLTVTCLLYLCHVWFVSWYGSVNSSGMGGLIPQSLQLQTQVMLQDGILREVVCAWIVVFLCSQTGGCASIHRLT
jgi:hypothetical protein